MDFFTNKFIAHRGLHNSKIIPENSLLSFEKAIEKNYAIEFDVTLSKDNKAIIFHDEELLRICNKKEKIQDLKYDYLRKLKLYNTDEYIPLFEEVLTLVNEKVALVIEIKKQKNVGILESIIVEHLKNYKGEYFICSFEKDILFWFRTNNKDIKRGLIFEFDSKRLFKFHKILFLYRYFKTKPNFISLNYKLYEKSSLSVFCKKKHIPLILWTINTSNNIKKYQDKIDGLIFERIII